MTIHSISGKPQPLPTVKTAPKTGVDGGKESAGKTVEKVDSVAITTIAKEIHKAFESSSAGSAIDFDRVAAVKKALADGSYAIDAERVAEKMIQFEKLFSSDNST